MRPATLYYLTKSFKTIGNTVKTGRDHSLFGAGTQDIVFTRSGSFIDLAAPYDSKAILEFRNVTINEGVSIVGHRLGYWSGVQAAAGHPKPFFLKVSDTLTVNGHLHMDGQGGGSAVTHHFAVNGTVADMACPLGYSTIGGNDCVSFDYYLNLLNYGLANTFFDCKTNLAGAGDSSHYKWKKATKYRHRRGYGTSPLNGGARDVGSRREAGGGGGFLALYYEDIDYRGNYWTDTRESSNTYGMEFMENINANGGAVTLNHGARIYGGGMMVIAARNIIVGPKGSITCNPALADDYYKTSVTRDNGYARGGVAFMNRPPKTPSLGQVNFSGGTLGGEMGGAGVCFGYQVTPEYTKVNE